MKIIGASILIMIGIGAGGLFRLMSLARDPDPTTSQQVVMRPSYELPGEFDSAPGSASNEDDLSETERNLRDKVRLLQQGKRFLEEVDGYSATLQKQEVVAGELLEEQMMQLKCRHRPFSVYLLWLSGDTGREVLFVEGQNEGRLIAHDGGWKARLPAFSLHPLSQLAMLDARHPVTSAGLQHLTETMLDIHVQDLVTSCVESCQVTTDQSFDGRRCTVFTTQYKSAATSPEYRKSITYIDHEWNVPVHSQHFSWPTPGQEVHEKDLDAATLVESYSFTDVKVPYPLADIDFDRSNPEYRFR